jgi:hypothetical protein
LVDWLYDGRPQLNGGREAYTDVICVRLTVSDQTRVRLVALVGPIAGERQMVHTMGYPIDPQKLLPLPDVLLLEASGDSGVMLFRYTAQGELAGDTWHKTVKDAQEQAIFEYRDALGKWSEVPADVTDAHAYAIRCAVSHREA